MKKCFKCGEVKDLSLFYKHKRMSDGHLNKCIDCTKLDVKEHRRNNIERVRQYDRERNSLPHRKELHNKVRMEYNSRHPNRVKVNSAIRMAVAKGEIVKPKECEKCGLKTRLVGHHQSYEKEKWLDVIWLCQPCHSAEHIMR